MLLPEASKLALSTVIQVKQQQATVAIVGGAGASLGIGPVTAAVVGVGVLAGTVILANNLASQPWMNTGSDIFASEGPPGNIEGAFPGDCTTGTNTTPAPSSSGGGARKGPPVSFRGQEFVLTDHALDEKLPSYGMDVEDLQELLNRQGWRAVGTEHPRRQMYQLNVSTNRSLRIVTEGNVIVTVYRAQR